MSLSKPSCERQSGDFCKRTDEELMQYATAGHGDAVTILFDRYHRLVFDVALRIVRDPGEAEDVVQNVFPPAPACRTPTASPVTPSSPPSLPPSVLFVRHSSAPTIPSRTPGSPPR